jgi:phosphotriesterase-related protein
MLLSTGTRALDAFDKSDQVMSVTGLMPAHEMGLTLSHEHALANFQPYADWIKQPLTYDRNEVIAVVLPHLEKLRALGCRTFVDATAAHLGRDPRVLLELAKKSGLHILTVTGAYAAFDAKFLPQYVREESTSQVAARWTKECVEGIDGTSVRPGFIKLGFNGGPLTKPEETLIRAAAITHRETGLTIGAHTGPAVAAFAQLKILGEQGVHPSAWIWIHAQNEPDLARHIEAARRGAWIEFDGYRIDETAAYVDRVRRMRDAGLLNHVLLSQDAGWYSVGEPRGGKEFRPYEPILTTLIPALRSAGFTAEETNTLFIRNPAKAFAVRVRAS